MQLVDVRRIHWQQVIEADGAGRQRLLQHQLQQDSTWWTTQANTRPSQRHQERMHFILMLHSKYHRKVSGKSINCRDKPLLCIVRGVLDRKGSGRDESWVSPDVLLDVCFSLPSFRFFTGVALDGTLAPKISLVMKPFPVEDGELLLPRVTWPMLLSTLGLRAKTKGGRDIRRKIRTDVQQAQPQLWTKNWNNLSYSRLHTPLEWQTCFVGEARHSCFCLKWAAWS